MCFGGSTYTPTAVDTPPPAPTPIETTGEVTNKAQLSNLNVSKFGRNSLLINKLMSSANLPASQTNLPTGSSGNSSGTNL